MTARILIADHNQQVSAELQAILSEHYEVWIAEDCSSCLVQVEQFRPDLVLLDIWICQAENGSKPAASSSSRTSLRSVT